MGVYGRLGEEGGERREMTEDGDEGFGDGEEKKKEERR